MEDVEFAEFLRCLPDDLPQEESCDDVYVRFASMEDVVMQNATLDALRPALFFDPVVPVIEHFTKPAPTRQKRRKKDPARVPTTHPCMIPLPPLSHDGLALAPEECRKLHSLVEVQVVAREAADAVRAAKQVRLAYDALNAYDAIKHAFGLLDKHADKELEALKRAAVEAADELVIVAHLAPPRLARSIKKKKKKKKKKPLEVV